MHCGTGFFDEWLTLVTLSQLLLALELPQVSVEIGGLKVY